MKNTLPNYLTLLRVFLIPVFVAVFYLPYEWAHFIAAMIFALACITDLLDGYLARKWDQTSRFGAFLDPVADKLIVSTALVMIVAIPWIHGVVIPIAIIIGREILVSALREWMAQIGDRTKVAVANVAKWKTLSQMVGIGFLIGYTPNMPEFLLVIGYLTLWIATFLTLWTMIVYLYAARHSFDEQA
jgi:CDP-diacylglycerol--glycerol-3-phosphate 3-phosphatidyltransferase